jgi:hypothetical protein
MATDTPKLFAGGLSWDSLNVYFGIIGSTGNLAMVSMLSRFANVSKVLVASLGLAIYPLIIGLKKPMDSKKRIVIGSIVWIVWFWFSNTFFTTFKYLVIIAPLIAVYVVVGLNKLPKWHTMIVALSAIVLIGVNGIYLNADVLAKADPQVTTIHDTLLSLPDGTAVLTPRGGAYGFALFYTLSEGKDITPVLLAKQVFNPDGTVTIDQGYLDYLDWFRERYDLEGSDQFAMSRDALDRDIPLYFLAPDAYEGYGDIFEVEEIGVYGLVKVKSVKATSWLEWQESKGR